MIQVPDADDVTALASVASQADLTLTYAGSVQNAIHQVAEAGGVTLLYSGSDRNAIEILAAMLSEDQLAPYILALDDDGTFAAMLSASLMPADEPDYLTATHAFTPGRVEVASFVAMPAGLEAAAPVEDGVYGFEVLLKGLPDSISDESGGIVISLNAGSLVALVNGAGDLIGGVNLGLYLQPGEVAQLRMNQAGGLELFRVPLPGFAGGNHRIGLYVNAETGQVGYQWAGVDEGYVPDVAFGAVAGVLPGFFADEWGGFQEGVVVDYEMIWRGADIAGPMPAGTKGLDGAVI